MYDQGVIEDHYSPWYDSRYAHPFLPFFIYIIQLLHQSDLIINLIRTKWNLPPMPDVIVGTPVGATLDHVSGVQAFLPGTCTTGTSLLITGTAITRATDGMVCVVALT